MKARGHLSRMRITRFLVGGRGRGGGGLVSFSDDWSHVPSCSGGVVSEGDMAVKIRLTPDVNRQVLSRRCCHRNLLCCECAVIYF